MVKFKVKANPSGQYYLPKEVREELGEKLELVCNAKAAVIFPEGRSLKTVLESLEVIQKDLSHRQTLKEEKVVWKRRRLASTPYSCSPAIANTCTRRRQKHGAQQQCKHTKQISLLTLLPCILCSLYLLTSTQTRNLAIMLFKLFC